MATIAIGDIHGHRLALDDLLGQITGEVVEGDTVVFLGDWGAGTFPGGYEGAEVVLYGHWNEAALDADGWPAPTDTGNTIGVDTISHGVLTAVRVPDRRVFQSARYESYC